MRETVGQAAVVADPARLQQILTRHGIRRPRVRIEVFAAAPYHARLRGAPALLYQGPRRRTALGALRRMQPHVDLVICAERSNLDEFEALGFRAALADAALPSHLVRLGRREASSLPLRVRLVHCGRPRTEDGLLERFARLSRHHVMGLDDGPADLTILHLREDIPDVAGFPDPFVLAMDDFVDPFACTARIGEVLHPVGVASERPIHGPASTQPIPWLTLLPRWFPMTRPARPEARITVAVPPRSIERKLLVERILAHCENHVAGAVVLCTDAERTAEGAPTGRASAALPIHAWRAIVEGAVPLFFASEVPNDDMEAGCLFVRDDLADLEELARRVSDADLLDRTAQHGWDALAGREQFQDTAMAAALDDWLVWRAGAAQQITRTPSNVSA
jgi:hypothetical protein